VDSNKRIAFAATDVFLRMNGYRIHSLPMAINADMMQMFDTNTFNWAHVEPWLRTIVVKI
jgi:death-on-curing protein